MRDTAQGQKGGKAQHSGISGGWVELEGTRAFDDVGVVGLFRLLVLSGGGAGTVTVFVAVRLCAQRSGPPHMQAVSEEEAEKSAKDRGQPMPNSAFCLARSASRSADFDTCRSTPNQPLDLTQKKRGVGGGVPRQ
jgi:hypothetical protein